MSYVDNITGVVVADWWDIWTFEEYEKMIGDIYDEIDEERLEFINNVDKYILDIMKDSYVKYDFYEEYGILIIKVEIIEIVKCDADQGMFDCNKYVKAKVKINGVLGILDINSYYYSATRMEPEDSGIEVEWEKLKGGY